MRETSYGAGMSSCQHRACHASADECTPLLFKAVFIQFTDVLVTNLKHEFSKQGSGPGDDLLMESVTLTSASLTFTSGGTSVTCSQSTNTCQ